MVTATTLVVQCFALLHCSTNQTSAGCWGSKGGGGVYASAMRPKGGVFPLGLWHVCFRTRHWKPSAQGEGDMTPAVSGSACWGKRWPEGLGQLALSWGPKGPPADGEGGRGLGPWLAEPGFPGSGCWYFNLWLSATPCPCPALVISHPLYNSPLLPQRDGPRENGTTTAHEQRNTMANEGKCANHQKSIPVPPGVNVA